jgi:hypothetical protein
MKRPKSKSNEAADKKVQLVPLNHPEFALIKALFPPTGTGPAGSLPEVVTSAPLKPLVHPPMYAGAVGGTLTNGKEVRHERV